IDGAGRVYVTDRDNERIEVFDADGKFLTEWKGTGRVSGLAITKDDRIWTGEVLRDLAGTILEKLPANPGGHGVAVTESGDVYIAQLSGVVQKFIKRPVFGLDQLAVFANLAGQCRTQFEEGETR